VTAHPFAPRDLGWSDDAVNFDHVRPVLAAIGMAGAADEALDLDALADETGFETSELLEVLAEIDNAGLALIDAEHESPLLLTAGAQYLAADGQVDRWVLEFLPRVIDDLHARRALLVAGIVMVDEFRAAIRGGGGLEHALGLVPPAFAAAIEERHVPDLFAACVALMARLSASDPPGCVGEEIMMANLVNEAGLTLERYVDCEGLPTEDARAATAVLGNLFELAGDADVYDLYEMQDPGDAAVAAHDPAKHQLGVADQRLEAWFVPFAWTAPSGYLHSGRL